MPHWRTFGRASAATPQGPAATATHVVAVAIRFHAQQGDPELRARCLDVFDVLVAHRAARPLLQPELEWSTSVSGMSPTASIAERDQALAEWADRNAHSCDGDFE